MLDSSPLLLCWGGTCWILGYWFSESEKNQAGSTKLVQDTMTAEAIPTDSSLSTHRSGSLETGIFRETPSQLLTPWFMSELSPSKRSRFPLSLHRFRVKIAL